MEGMEEEGMVGGGGMIGGEAKFLAVSLGDGEF